MKFVNFKLDGKIKLGIKCKKGIIDVEQAANDYLLEAPNTMEDVISSGEVGRLQLIELMKKDVEILREENITYAPCILNPEKILCVGLNYISHAKECNKDIPTSPVIFSKFNNALAAHNETITLPKAAEKFDYEAELVIVIGKEAANISEEEAASYIFGYTIGNDLSARDLQFRSAQWLLGKTCDKFAPIGPYLVTADELDFSNLEISCRVNGELRQLSNTSDMIFNCAKIVSYISNYMTLKPGDIIFTGTPSGVILGYSEGSQQWLKSGDEVVVSIENIGRLSNVLK
ncbi:fumarylacetoacetate hydrolase family protein [Clostridium sp.]|uniref:fumarylacetoacetate hydrolase family protein n=1 Tax=Clostridium sp. TaxID=1506 RepID=UPI002FCC3668